MTSRYDPKDPCLDPEYNRGLEHVDAEDLEREDILDVECCHWCFVEPASAEHFPYCCSECGLRAELDDLEPLDPRD